MLLICAALGHTLFTLFHCNRLHRFPKVPGYLGIRGAGLMYHCMWSRRPSLILSPYCV